MLKNQLRTIGILENLEPNHVQTLNALVKSYSRLPNTQIIAFVSQTTLNHIENLGLENLTKVFVQKENQTNSQFLEQVSQITKANPLSKLHICSTKNLYRDFAQFKPFTKEILLHIHNTDIWFEKSVKYHLDSLIYDLKNDESNRKKINIIARFFINITTRAYYINKILKNYQRHYNLKFVVQNSNIAKNIPSNQPNQPNQPNLLIFPFACYEGNNHSSTDLYNIIPQIPQKLRVGICGTVTQSRRDYLGLFVALEKLKPELKSRLEFTLLGNLSPAEKNIFETKIRHLQIQGIQIKQSLKNNTSMDYQLNMQKCDILLNLVKINKGAHSIYSVTKESGMIGDMISSSKPGLLPNNYFLEKSLLKSTLKFDTISHLLKLLEDLIINPKKLEQLKKEAKISSLSFTPEILCKTLNTQI